MHSVIQELKHDFNEKTPNIVIADLIRNPLDIVQCRFTSTFSPRGSRVKPGMTSNSSFFSRIKHSQAFRFPKSFWEAALLVGILFTLLFAFPALALAQDIRVLLESSTVDTISVNINSGDYELQDDSGRWLADIQRGAKIEIENYRNGFSVYVGGKLIADKQPGICLSAAANDGLFEYKGKLYRANLSMVSNGTSIYIINKLDVEYYLYGVVGREIGYNQPLEAVKAQAVACRSFALAKLNTANRYYDIGSDVLAQSYGGYAAEKEAAASNIIRAVDATAGEIICYRGEPFESYYHSNAGGHTEDIANVWGGNIPLLGVPSPYDDYVEKSGYSTGIYHWQVTYSGAELRALAERYAGRNIGAYRGIELSTTGANGKPSASGRVMEVVIKGESGQVSAQRDDIRSLLGNLKSTFFSLENWDNILTVSSDTTFYVLDKGQTTPQPVKDIGAYYVQTDSGGILSRLVDWGLNFTIKGARQSVKVGSGSAVSGNSASSTGNVTFYGKGYGHGVGMSQWGAIGMAADGFTYDEILSYYYNMKNNRDFALTHYR